MEHEPNELEWNHPSPYILLGGKNQKKKMLENRLFAKQKAKRYQNVRSLAQQNPHIREGYRS